MSVGAPSEFPIEPTLGVGSYLQRSDKNQTSPTLGALNASGEKDFQPDCTSERTANPGAEAGLLCHSWKAP